MRIASWRPAGRQARKKSWLKDRKEELDAVLLSIQERVGEYSHITVAYFQPDTKKDGGEYMEKTGRLKKIDK